MIYSLYNISEGILKSITKASKDLITNASQYLFREHSQSEADLSTRWTVSRDWHILPWSVKVDRAQVKSKNRGRHDYRTLLTIANSAVKSSPALPIYRQSWVISFWKSELRIKRRKTLLQKTWKLKVVSGSSAPQWRTSQRISKSLLKVFLFGKWFSCRGIVNSFLRLHQRRSMMALIWNDSDWTSVQFCQELRKTDKKHCGIVYILWNFETIHCKTI